jgi:hypothetical protein
MFIKIKPVIFLSFLIIYACKPASDSNPNPQLTRLEQEFKNPPTSARPKGFWSWVNGNFDLERLTIELEESKANGMGGYDIWDVANLADYENKVPAGPAFMGEESTNAIVYAIKEATRLNLEIGLVVASSWNSGGSWIKPEHGVMGILDTTLVVRGQQDLPEKFPFPPLPKYDAYDKEREMLISKDLNGLPEFYKEVAILAIPIASKLDTNQIIDLSDKFEDGKLNWQVPEGEWKITRYIYTNLGTPLKRPSPNSNGLMIDHFSKEAQKTHLQYFIDKLQPQLGGDLGETALKYLYNDSYEIKGPVWTPTMLQEFKKRRGYDMTPFLPVLQGEIVQNQEVTSRFLYDYRMTLSDLSIDNHYKFGVEFCNQYGIGFQAEGGGPGPPLHDVPVESIKALGALSVPRGEFWHNYPKYDDEGYDSHWFIKGIASAAHLYDQTFVEAESFTSLTHWQESWQDLKPTADQAFCEGLNRVVFHTSTHSPDAFGSPGYVYGFGTHMNTRQTWWPKSRAWIDYLARNSYMLQQGNFVGDLLYYYGDQAPNFAKQRHIDSTLGFGYDYDVINTEKLLELEVKDGKMTLPHGQEYALLVLPEQKDMPLPVLEKIEKMIKAGALVVGPKPERTPGLHNYLENDQTLKSLANQMWSGLTADQNGFNKIGRGKLYWSTDQRDILFENGVFPDFSFKGQDDSVSLNFIHRRLGETDIYFIRNRQNREVTAECVFRVADKKPSLWSPETGEVVEDLIYRNEGDSIRMALSFAPHDAYFIVFADNDNTPFVEKVEKDNQAIFPSTGSYAKLQGYQVKTGQFTQPGGYYFEYNNGERTYAVFNRVNEIPVEGEWQLRFPAGWGAPETAAFTRLQSWTESKDDGIKYFSGIAKYEIDFEMDSVIAELRYFLDLGDVREIAEVWLNGESLGTIWHQPFQLEIGNHLQSGKNHLVVDVVNEWNNRLVGDGHLPAEERFTNTNIVNGPKAWGTPWKNVPLQPAGLLGPVKIQIYRK